MKPLTYEKILKLGFSPTERNIFSEYSSTHDMPIYSEKVEENKISFFISINDNPVFNGASQFTVPESEITEDILEESRMYFLLSILNKFGNLLSNALRENKLPI